ncbi:hypothetical protein [Uliginosibacterium sediminicola]|uniref:hypothetical protein n=1 Tax=Uliginosibacterium sediminicola TaxID=2024550 RepID=UPI003D102F76
MNSHLVGIEDGAKMLALMERGSHLVGLASETRRRTADHFSSVGAVVSGAVSRFHDFMKTSAIAVAY